MDRTWRCDNRQGDGSSCPQVLTAKVKFCPECGKLNKPPDANPPVPEYHWPCPQLLDNGSTCGEELSTRYKFCPNCGKVPGTPLCRHCLRELEKISRFCPDCGCRLINTAGSLAPKLQPEVPVRGTVPKPLPISTPKAPDAFHQAQPQKTIDDAMTESLTDPPTSLPESEATPVTRGLMITSPVGSVSIAHQSGSSRAAQVKPALDVEEHRDNRLAYQSTESHGCVNVDGHSSPRLQAAKLPQSEFSVEPLSEQLFQSQSLSIPATDNRSEATNQDTSTMVSDEDDASIVIIDQTKVSPAELPSSPIMISDVDESIEIIEHHKPSSEQTRYVTRSQSNFAGPLIINSQEVNTPDGTAVAASIVDEDVANKEHHDCVSSAPEQHRDVSLPSHENKNPPLQDKSRGSSCSDISSLHEETPSLADDFDFCGGASDDEHIPKGEQTSSNDTPEKGNNQVPTSALYTNRSVFSGGAAFDRSGVALKQQPVFGQQAQQLPYVGKAVEVAPCKGDTDTAITVEPADIDMGKESSEQEALRKKRMEYFQAQEEPVSIPGFTERAAKADVNMKSDQQKSRASEVPTPSYTVGVCQQDEFLHSEPKIVKEVALGQAATPEHTTHVSSCEVQLEVSREGLIPPSKVPDTCVEISNAEQLGASERSQKTKASQQPEQESTQQSADVSVSSASNEQPQQCSHHPLQDVAKPSEEQTEDQRNHNINNNEIQKGTTALAGAGQAEGPDYANTATPVDGPSKRKSITSASDHPISKNKSQKNEESSAGPASPSMQGSNMPARADEAKQCVTDSPGTPISSTRYNKKEKQEDDYVAPTTKGKNKKWQNQTNVSDQNQHFVTLHFHVIVDSEFKYNRKAADVYVMFGETSLGGWKVPKYELKPVRETQREGALLSGDVQIPLHLLRYKKRIQYKYVLIRKDSKDLIWEMIKNDKNRILMIPNPTLPGSVHIYDGIIVRKPDDGLLKRGAKYVMGITAKNMVSYATTALVEMMPSWEGFSRTVTQDLLGTVLTAEAAYNRILELRAAMERWPVCEDMSKKDKDDCFKGVVKDLVWGRIETFNENNATTETDEETSLRLASAMVIVLLTVVFNVDLNQKGRRRLMGALMVKPSETKECPEYSKLVKHHFPGKERMLSENIIIFIRQHLSNNKDDYRWFKCVPLLHFLQGNSKPYEVTPIVTSPNHRTIDWWGITEILEIVNQFKAGVAYKDAPANLFASLSPYYCVDLLLPRTILACLSRKHIELVLGLDTLPPEAVMAMLYFHIVNNPDVYVKEDVPLLQQLTPRLSTNRFLQLGVDHALKVCNVAFIVALDVMDAAVQRSMERNTLVGHTTVVQTIYIALETIEAMNKITENRDEKEKRQLKHHEKMLIGRVDQWLGVWLPPNMHMYLYTNARRDTPISVEIEVWNALLMVDFPDTETNNFWKSFLLSRLNERVTKLKSSDVLSIYSYHLKFESHCQALIDCLSDHAFDAAEEEMKHPSGFLMHEHNVHKELWRIFSRAFMKIWPKTTGNATHEELLKHILTLPAFKRFLQFFTNEAASRILNDECQNCLATAKSLLSTTVYDLASGEILVSQLACVLENPNALVENAAAAEEWSTEVPNPEVLMKTIEWRRKEMEALEEYKKKVSILRNICRNYVDTADLECKLGKTTMNLKVNAFCDCARYNPESGMFDKTAPKVTLFSLPPEIEQKMDVLIGLHTSQIFLMVLEEVCQVMAPRKSLDAQVPICSLEDFFGVILPKAMDQWHNLCRQICDGSIPVEMVKVVFESFYQHEDRLTEELYHIFDGKDDPRRHERLQEIIRYSKISQYEQGARVMMDAKKTLNLSGDFRVLEKILNATQGHAVELKAITEDVATAGQALQDLKREHVACLSAYLKCQPLVNWLREHIQVIQELKGFVDLALISATGKDDMEVTKVSCLHAAVSGFAPLIYDLKKTADFKQFYDKCKEVWRVYDVDRDLVRKLVSLNNELEWLKGVNEAQGDVEVNALKQVAAINNRGIYIIGHQDGHGTIPVEENIRIVVPPENKNDPHAKTKRYLLADLKELQSKLMLVAGKAEKGKEDVDSFVEKFDGITGLANTYSNICSAGNILFKTWTAKFFCDVSLRTNAVIDFGLSSHKLTGFTKDTNVTDQINQVRQFIESCLEEWKQYIEKERQEFPDLNHYTTEQLVILRCQLAKLLSNEDALVDKVIALLTDVRPDCTLKHIMDACKEAAKEIKPTEETCTKEAAEEEQEEGDKLAAFRILESQYGKRIVAEARAQLSPDAEIDEVEYKCMDLEDERMDVDETGSTEEAMPSLGTTESMKDMADKFMQQLTKDQKSNLRQKLDQLWENVHTSSAKSMADYLSVEHLGRILQHLANNKPLDRALPPYMKEGQPNLIVCAARDILSTVVSVYMENEDLPLPTRSEVLLCNEATSTEEVELLVRRAVNNRTGKIFLVVNVHLLNYEVADHLERCIEKHTQGQVEYRLGIVCSSEQQDRSQLVTALDSHRVHTPYRPPNILLQVYLLKHLKGEKGTACEVDPESSTVRVVRSDRAGMGKTLRMRRMVEELGLRSRQLRNGTRFQSFSLPLFGKVASSQRVLDSLMPYTPQHDHHIISLYHIDIPHEMQDGVDHLLFNLVVLGSLVDPLGYAWRRSPRDLYVIEIMPLQCWETGVGDPREEGQESVHHCLEFLPTITCRSPQQSLVALEEQSQRAERRDHDQLMDNGEFMSTHFQRVSQYLLQLHLGGNLRDIDPYVVQGSQSDCLQILMQYCGLHDPSWAELVHFVRFLDTQLTACEHSSFCSISATSDDALPGFLKFVVRFMIQMSKDFSTRSLQMAEETSTGAAVLQQGNDEALEQEIQQFQLKRRWETSPHPYIFFNPDRASMTFLGFVIRKPDFDVVDPRNNQVLEEKIMNKYLFEGLRGNGVNLSEDFDNLPRLEKIQKLCMVMGNEMPHDPDDKYVLTADNVKKILAIQMRFRCNIPVVIMGETGCGKTELIKFMCKLQCPPAVNVKNMLLVKVHGGTTEEYLIKKIQEGQKLAEENQQKFPGVHTVLFLDEVNTTEALGLVKEVLCDHTLNGTALHYGSSLRLIAACNPYRKHSQDVIDKLEQAGLGYHVKADQTADKLGRIPMRRLVYRVQPLPQSLLPLVWDFGQLPPNIEQLYIHQIVKKKLSSDEFDGVSAATAISITNVLVAAQTFMREQQDECSFVSLRDVKRAMDVMAWFYQQDHMFEMMDAYKQRELARAKIVLFRQNRADDSHEEEELEDDYMPPSYLARSLILALGVCYHACLQDKREDFRKHVSEMFEGELELAEGPATILEEISLCQNVFLDGIDLGPNIAKNQALKENVFMMVVCIELRIPLFLVGKPGSSKSLAKTIVMDSMQGPNSQSELFKNLKQVYMVSYQCSPLSTPDGIVSIFGQCAQLQKDKGDMDKFVAVVVLDEIGLAEDSPRMPLKALHPLLEDGCAGDEEEGEHKKVGFIGISNWALDPAKMNRGILVQRGPPGIEELEQTATDICSSDKNISMHIAQLMEPLAHGYIKLYEEACEIREFYGLRDFYSLVKMVHWFAQRNGAMPTWTQLEHAILRNFGGLDSAKPLEVFEGHLAGIVDKRPPKRGDPDNTPSGLIRESLQGNTFNCESRYLLVLTENYAALQILQQDLDAMKNAIIIFGSSFPKDQDYVVVCRNINRIKVCMETGQTVVLLNLESLYESLYDALNQYYTYFGGQRHVDLGLGSHRVKSRVHKDFKLIVVAEKEVVYKKFPIPLINRLEKHFVARSTMLTKRQQRIVQMLSDWTKGLAEMPVTATAGKRKAQPTASDVFIGYHHDTCATLVLQVCYDMKKSSGDNAWVEEVLKRSKEILLQCATPEAIVRARKSQLRADEDDLMAMYFQQQQHESLAEYLKVHLGPDNTETNFIQVTTHSRLLSNKDIADIAETLGLPPSAVNSQALHAFNTEQQFSNLLRSYFTVRRTTDQLLIIQCDSGDKSGELIACARYMIREEFNQAEDASVHDTQQIKHHIVIIVQLPRIVGGCFIGFQGGMWKSVHLDELRVQQNRIPSVAALRNTSVSSLVGCAINTQLLKTQPTERQEQDMEVDPQEDEVNVIQAGEDDPSLVDDIRNRFDFHQLLRSCIHSASAMLKDADVGKSTIRIHLLLALVPEASEESDDQVTFSNIMKERIHMILKDKEETKMFGTMAVDWLINEAAGVDAINKSGTFRRSVLDYLEAKVTPIFAGLIAFVDTNDNLRLVCEDGWKQQMWLELLRNPRLTPLVYEDLVSAKRGTELKEIPVQMKGIDGAAMCGRVPFSWLLKAYIDDLVNRKRKEMVDDQEIIKSVGHVLMQSPWWPILQTSFKNASKEVVLEFYMEDFVEMTYKPRTANEQVEYQLVKRALKTALAQLEKQPVSGQPGRDETKDEDVYGFEHLIPMLHVAEAAIHSRLQLFAEVVLHHSQILAALQGFIAELPDHPLASENEIALDVLAVQIVVRDIQPNHKLLRNAESSREWLAKVDLISPLVNAILARVNSLAMGGIGSYSPACLEALREIWCNWNRVSAVKLFIETVCPAGSDQEKYVTRHGPMLFKNLAKADFKKEETMKSVETFLQRITKNACTEYLGEVQKCPMCKEDMITAVVMPCDDEICEECHAQLVRADDLSCCVCKKPYDKDTKLDKREKSKEAVKKLQVFKQRCNAFLTELVSRMCFAGKTPPDDGVVKMLLGYITTKRLRDGEGQMKLRPRIVTKAMNLFNDNLDPTPVVRSVLLQLLLRSNVDKVNDHLEAYFEEARQVVTNENEVIELAVLYIQCLEDHYHNTAASSDIQDRYPLAIKLLKTSRDELRSDLVTKLAGIAKARFGLSIVAECMINVHVKKQIPADTTTIDRLFRVARHLCIVEEQLGPCIFLIRQIVRRYSLNELQQVAAALPWIVPEFARPDEDADRADEFVVLGTNYAETRNSINEALVSNSTEALEKCIKGAGVNKEHQILNILLAVYREITSCYRVRDVRRRPQPEAVENVKKACEAVPSLQEHRALLVALVENGLGQQCPQLQVTPNMSHVHRALQEIVVHFMAAMATSGKSNLMMPILTLATDPTSMMDCFLPTMPEDMRATIHQALLAARGTAGADDNPFLYECPNGHAYVIGNCGRPVTMGRCNHCGEKIGGASYNLADRNKAADRADTTKQGHALGQAENRSLVPIPERALTPACNALIRLLVHLGLYIGANTNQQGVCNLITPAIRPGDVPNFLWQHLMADLEVISRATGKGKDDTVLLVHLLIQNLSSKYKELNQCKNIQLTSKQKRAAWETQCSQCLVMPILNNLDEEMRKANDAITNDDRQSNNMLRRVVHEVDNQHTEGGDVDQAPAVWRYRTRVSMEHLMQALSENIATHGEQDQEELRQYQILHLFLTKEPLLRVVRLIPRLLKFLTILTQCYHRKIDRSEANEITIKAFFKEAKNDQLRERFESLFDDFATAWTAVHDKLQTHVVSGRVLPKEYCNQRITHDTRLSTFLPSLHDRGLCAVALLHYLASVHNEFIDDYCRITKSPARPVVSFPDLTPAHLIMYDPDRDLLPIVLANCTYSLEVGHGTKIEYNFKNLEQHLIERFIKGRALLALQLEHICYREELNNAAFFKSLQRKIPQRPISEAVKEQIIRGDCQYMYEVSDCLSSLDIAVGFLTSVGGDADDLLTDFMTNTLRMDLGSLFEVARRHCRLSHCKALWLLLSHEREKFAARYRQGPFTSVDVRDYQVELTDEQETQLRLSLTQVDVERFLSELHECIVLHLTVQTDPNDEDYVDNKKHPLRDELIAYIDGKDGEPIAALSNGAFLDGITADQCVDTWQVAYAFYRNLAN